MRQEMNIIQKRLGSINEIRKVFRKKRTEEELAFEVGRTPRDELSKLLVVCGRVSKEDISKYREKSQEIEADFVEESAASWITVHKNIRKTFEIGKHEALLLIGTDKQIPSTQIGHEGSLATTDFFYQDVDGDGLPDTPVGRILGPSETILYHMDPMVIDSNIAIVFDSQPGRSSRHVEGLASLGLDVEVLKRFTPDEARLLSVSEFILQFSDGVYTQRIHGSPDRWASHNSVILSHEHAASIRFEGYPLVFSEACSTAQEGLLLKAFLDQGACYLGATLDTVNNSEPYDDWRDCPFADGVKWGFLDLLDTYDVIGQVKVNVDREIYERLDEEIVKEIDLARTGEQPVLPSHQSLSLLEWKMFGNPMRRTTIGPEADFTPGRIVVDT
ncbi:MAG: hypothetical protein JSW61_01040 [Candidatus Thorarchaeota archaeon]|nr:MAG: hypothetical protein JSW61_01040 [Candidatus Thorarchaeota archaeon]